MKTWRRSLLLLTVTSTLLLTGCTGGGSSARSKLEAAQSVYRTMSGCTAQAEITADYGQRVYGYTVDLTVQGGSGVMTVKQPENLAGTVLTWSDGETQLAFDGTELDTGTLSDSGLSPADAMPTILTACQGGEIRGLLHGGAGGCPGAPRHPGLGRRPGRADSVLVPAGQLRPPASGAFPRWGDGGHHAIF